MGGYYPGECVSIQELAISVSKIIEEALKKVNITEKIEKLSTSLKPMKNKKGSINGEEEDEAESNCGGGASASDCKKKSESCGGGGGGCGGSKKSSSEKIKLKVTFYDFYGNVITTVETAKGSNAEVPWKDDTDIKEEYKVEGFKFKTWNPYPLSVEEDMECKSVWYIKDTTEIVESLCDNATNLVNEAQSELIQEFNDYYLNSDITQSAEGIFNTAISDITDRIDYVTDTVNDAMDKLSEIEDTCYETKIKAYNDTKKCILNAQSSFIFQSRMSFNLDFRNSSSVLKQYTDPITKEVKSIYENVKNTDVPSTITECVYDKVNRYTQQSLDLVRNGYGDKLTETVEQYKQELNDDINYYLDNNKKALNEFKSTYNSCVDNINSCFSTNPLDKIF